MRSVRTPARLKNGTPERTSYCSAWRPRHANKGMMESLGQGTIRERGNDGVLARTPERTGESNWDGQR